MKKPFCLSLAVCLVLGGFAPLASAQPDATGEPPKKLISLEFPETSLSTILDILSIKTGKRFITDIDLAKKRVLLNLKDVTPDEALNALLDTYNLYYVRQSETSNIFVIKKKPDEVQATVSQQLFFLNYASAHALENVVKQKLSKNGQVSTDERTNSLFITDVADNIDKIGAIIKQLDIPTLQVLLEAKIVDVKIDTKLQIGADITNLARTDQYTTNPLDLYYHNKYDPTGKIEKTSIKPVASYAQTFSPGLQSGSGKISFSVIGNNYNIDGLVEAMKRDGNARLLTNPRLLVMNNSEANIEIVDQIPYQERTIASGVTTVSTVFKDVGIQLRVKPQISRDGTIILTVTPENSFQNGTTSDNVPVVNKTRSNTTFILRDGETAVIGGLIRESDMKTEYKVPLLGDIPLLGFLFKSHSTEKTRSELTIFITAKVTQ
jgi:type IV pilus secretin PilQ/predicted competence protein